MDSKPAFQLQSSIVGIEVYLDHDIAMVLYLFTLTCIFGAYWIVINLRYPGEFIQTYFVHKSIVLLTLLIAHEPTSPHPRYKWALGHRKMIISVFD